MSAAEHIWRLHITLSSLAISGVDHDMPAPLATMPASPTKLYLPNEIWLEIASLCDLKDLWLSVRRVNQQLSACAERTVRNTFFQHATLIMTRAGPLGPETSRFRTIQSREGATSTPSDILMAVFYRTQTESGFSGPNNVCWWSQGLSIRRSREEQVRWDLELCGQRRIIVGLRPKFFLTDEHEEDDRFSVRWKTAMKLFCRPDDDTLPEHQPRGMRLKARKFGRRLDPSSLII